MGKRKKQRSDIRRTEKGQRGQVSSAGVNDGDDVPSKKPMTPERERQIADSVRDLAEPICESEQMEVVHVEFQREPGGRILRVYIDKPGGVDLDDCVRISRQLGDMLDVYMETECKYNLEVSSPGLDRPLGRLKDFERFKGNTARIKAATAIDGQKNFKGTLLGVVDGTIKLKASGDKEVGVPFSDIVKARLVDYSGDTSCS